MAERERVVLRIFPQQIRQVGTRSRCLRKKQKGEASHGDDGANSQKDCRRNPSVAPFAAIRVGRTFPLQPSADQQRHAWNRRNRVVLLPRREAEEALRSPRSTGKITDRHAGGASSASEIRASAAALPAAIAEETRSTESATEPATPRTAAAEPCRSRVERVVLRKRRMCSLTK